MASPLKSLISATLLQYGNYAPETIASHVRPMFIEFANQVIDEILMHPYGENLSIEHYVQEDETRDIEDSVMIAGLLYHYSLQQLSDKAQVYRPKYMTTMARQLYLKLHGNRKINLNIVDGGTAGGRYGNPVSKGL